MSRSSIARLAARLRGRRPVDPLADARAAWYERADRVAEIDAVVGEIGDEVAANVFPLRRPAGAEVIPFPTRPAA